MSGRIRIVVLLLALVAFFRFVPIGYKTPVQAVNPGAVQNIAIERRRYWIPREIAFSGFPFPGGDFRLLRDPHFDYSPASAFMLHDNGGNSLTGRIQIIGINPGFDNPNHVESLIAAEVAGRILEFDLGEIGVEYADTYFEFYMGTNGIEAYFLTPKDDAEFVIFSVDYSGNELVGKMSVLSPENYATNEIFQRVRTIIEEGLGSSPCSIRRIDLHELYRTQFGIVCDQ